MHKEIIEIPVSSIVPDPNNLRKTFDEKDIASLAANMEQHGQLDPIQIFVRDSAADTLTYDLFDGERRWRAAKLAGMQTLRAVVIDRPSPAELTCKKISRAMQTRSLSFSEEVKALEEGLTALRVREHPQKWASAAHRLGVRPGVLRERMRVTNLSPRLRAQFDQGALDYTIAQSLGRITDKARQERLVKFILEERLSNRFVMTRFVSAAMEFPEKSPLELYDIARYRDRFRYAKPREEEIPQSTVDRLDEILADFRKCEGWLEAAARENLLGQLAESPLNLRRFLLRLHRLSGMIEGYLTVYSRSADVQLFVQRAALPADGAKAQ